MLEALVDTEWT